jgi:hypothetical protein
MRATVCLFICSRKVDKNRPPLRIGHTEDNSSLQAPKQSGKDAEPAVNIPTVSMSSETQLHSRAGSKPNSFEFEIYVKNI